MIIIKVATTQLTPPIASNDMASTNINQSITIGVLANDTDADNDLLTITSLSPVSNGAASIVSEVPPFGNSSYDSTLPVTFTYTISDEMEVMIQLVLL